MAAVGRVPSNFGDRGDLFGLLKLFRLSVIFCQALHEAHNYMLGLLAEFNWI